MGNSGHLYRPLLQVVRERGGAGKIPPLPKRRRRRRRNCPRPRTRQCLPIKGEAVHDIQPGPRLCRIAISGQRCNCRLPAEGGMTTANSHRKPNRLFILSRHKLLQVLECSGGDRGHPAARLLARESFKRARGCRTSREETRRDWSASWEQGGKEEWTRNPIPNLGTWLDRQHGEVDSSMSIAKRPWRFPRLSVERA